MLFTILNYYREYHNDYFNNPKKKRHYENAIVRVKDYAPKEYPTDEDFFKFRDELKSFEHGEVMAALATVQYFQATRISEAAAVYWEDVVLGDKDFVEASEIRFSKKVEYLRVQNLAPQVVSGFKNSNTQTTKGIKISPMFPETYEVSVLTHSLHFIPET